MKLSDDLIQAQCDLELHGHQRGIELLRKQTERSEKGNYTSGTIYGRSLVSQTFQQVGKRIQVEAQKAKKGRSGEGFSLIKEQINLLTLDKRSPFGATYAEHAAMITLKTMLDVVGGLHGSEKENRLEPNALSNLERTVGQRYEWELQVHFYKTADEKLFKNIEKWHFKSVTGTHQKHTVLRKRFNDAGIHWPTWDNILRIRIGKLFIRCVEEETGWFSLETKYENKKTKNLIVFSDLFDKHRAQIMEWSEACSSWRLPMLAQPKPWSNEQHGGYYTNDLLHQTSMVRGHFGKRLHIQGEIPLLFLNNLQTVGYSFNSFIVKVAQQLDDLGWRVGKFQPRSALKNWPMPIKPLNAEEDSEVMRAWKQETKNAYSERKSYSRSTCVRTEKTLEAFRIMQKHLEKVDSNTWYLPWSFDTRGRIYPDPPFLQIQDSDFGKSIITFSDGSEITPEAEEWLAFHVANCAGLDKKPIADRIEWTNSNHELISAIVQDPIGHVAQWEGMDSPWCFLAAAEEYYALVITKERDYCHLPIAVDGTCSGIQHLAGLVRCAETANAVNVSPSEEPQDIYRRVSDWMLNNNFVPKKWQEVWGRSVVKRSVMTRPYAAKMDANVKYIKQGLEKELPNEYISKKEVHPLGKALWDALSYLAPPTITAMEWLADIAKEVITNGGKHVTWTSPSGFNCIQVYDNYHLVKVQGTLFGSTRSSYERGKSKGPVKTKHGNGFAPNYVHSCDAAMLHIALKDFDKPFSVIHDSVLGRATDMGEINERLRDTYAYMYQQDLLQRLADELHSEKEPPMINTLDVSSVIQSPYFMS